MNSILDNYFMKPQEVEGVGLVYPISIFDYLEFKELANMYILLDIKRLNNLKKQHGEALVKHDNLFDYIVDTMSLDDSNEEILRLVESLENTPKEVLMQIAEQQQEMAEIINNLSKLKGIASIGASEKMCKLIQMTVKNDVSFNEVSKSFIIKGDNKILGYIDKENFYSWRAKVMEQNVLFEPRIAPNKKSQEYLDKELNKGSANTDFEALVAFVATNIGDISHYTYYRLMADYTSLSKQMNFTNVMNMKANGCKGINGQDLEVPNLLDSLGVLNNPYEKLLKDAKESGLDKALQNR